MEFPQAVKTCLQEKYVKFSGRASRSEFWYFYLFSVILGLFANAGMYLSQSAGLFLSSVIYLAIYLPIMEATVRRLHDIDKSGWYILIGLIPILGWIYMIVILSRKGTNGSNRFGEQPVT